MYVHLMVEDVLCIKCVVSNCVCSTACSKVYQHYTLVEHTHVHTYVCTYVHATVCRLFEFHVVRFQCEVCTHQVATKFVNSPHNRSWHRSFSRSAVYLHTHALDWSGLLSTDRQDHTMDYNGNKKMKSSAYVHAWPTLKPRAFSITTLSTFMFTPPLCAYVIITL